MFDYPWEHYKGGIVQYLRDADPFYGEEVDYPEGLTSDDTLGPKRAVFDVNETFVGWIEYNRLVEPVRTEEDVFHTYKYPWIAYDVDGKRIDTERFRNSKLACQRLFGHYSHKQYIAMLEKDRRRRTGKFLDPDTRPLWKRLLWNVPS